MHVRASSMALTVAASLAGAAPPVEPRPRSLRVVSYNIQALAAGADGVLQSLRALSPDVVLLQEVDVGTARSGKRDQPAYLARELGMHARFAAAMPYDGGEYGLAILSREPLSDVAVLALPRQGAEEPRIALRARTQAGGVDVVVVDTHLAADWRAQHPAELRRDQARALHAWLAALPGQEPLLVGGDFNATPGSEPLNILAQGATLVSSGRPTFPADAPRQALDHVFSWNGRGRVQATGEEVMPSVASDHRPLLLELALPPAPDAAKVDTPPARWK